MSQPHLRLNLSDDEAKSEVRNYEVLPNGEYMCKIIEVLSKEVQPGKKHSGKPYYNIKFIVDEGKYEGRSLFSNVMLFEGALYSAKQLVEAVAPHLIEGNNISIPTPEYLEGKSVIVVGVKYGAGSKRKDKTTRENDQFEVKGFKSANSPVKTGDASLLP